MNAKSILIACAILAILLPASASAQSNDILLQLQSGSPPADRLAVDSAGGLVASGTANAGAIPAEGAGVRMMWFPGRWAFRAGRVVDAGSTNWDLNNIGLGSAAFGENTQASGRSSLAAGDRAIASGLNSVAFGDRAEATGHDSFAVSMGASATARGAIAIGSLAGAHDAHAVALGAGNQASGFSATSIGNHNNATATGAVAIGVKNEASGARSTAIGGYNVASADYSVAIGRAAGTGNHRGSIVISAGTNTTRDTVYSTADYQIVMRGGGGMKIYTTQNLWGSVAGVELAPGGNSWGQVSDVNRKENFEALDGEDVLVRLREVPVMTWNYLSQDASIRHAGPTAQDFHAAFGLGESELLINTIDIDGINLAAIKALDERTRELDGARAEIDALRSELAAQKLRIELLERRQQEILERLDRIENRR
jgi:hypothetical protein